MKLFKKNSGLTTLEFAVIALVIALVIVLFLSSTIKLMKNTQVRADVESAQNLMTAIRIQHITEGEPLLYGVLSYDTYNPGKDYTKNLVKDIEFLKSLNHYDDLSYPTTGSQNNGYWIKYNKDTGKYFVHWVDDKDPRKAYGSVESSVSLWSGVVGEKLIEIIE